MCIRDRLIGDKQGVTGLQRVCLAAYIGHTLYRAIPRVRQKGILAQHERQFIPGVGLNGDPRHQRDIPLMNRGMHLHDLRLLRDPIGLRLVWLCGLFRRACGRP